MQRHNGQPPVHGSIPDMTASTDLYVHLQTVYREQAACDVREMKQLLLASSNDDADDDATIVDDETIAIFSQNVYAIDLLQTGCLADVDEEPSEEICQELALATMEGDDDERPEQIPLLWYLGFRACQLFYAEHGRYPGTIADYQSDVAVLQTCMVAAVQQYRLSDNEVVRATVLQSGSGSHKYAEEMTRYGNAEIHTVASVVGGVASQEAVKIITGQYVPINNTYVYNGIASVGAVYKF
jgi:amyloid beta precursor protein binding protein 1